MQRHHLTIEGQKFYLPADADVDELGERFVLASRNGGEVVTVDIVGARTLRVVATPGPPIVIESEEIGMPDDDGGRNLPPMATHLTDDI